MTTVNFWPFFNHLLTEESEPYNATPVVNRLLPLFPTLAEKTPSGFERKLFNFLFDYVTQYSVAPSRMSFYSSIAATLHGESEEQDLRDYSARVQSNLIPRYGLQDSHMLLDKYEQGRDLYLLQETVKTAMEINNAPFKVNGKELYGFNAALDFAQRSIASLGTSANDINRIDLEENGEDALARYEAEKEDAASCMKMLVGLKEIDEHFKGFRKGELITLMGYTGDGKTTTCVNWAYEAFLQGFNAVYITLEMSADDIRDRFHVRHAANFDLFSEDRAIALTKYMDKELTEDDKTFMFGTVVPDFQRNNDPQYGLRGTLRVIEPKEGGFNFSLLKSELLRLHADCPIDVFFLDYPNLMDVAPERGQDFDKAMSRLYVKLKTLCRTFNDGDRLIGVIPTQINRAGREAAEKNNGIYNLRAIQEYSEIANSSDFVFGGFRDAAMAGANECLFSNPKARRAGPVLPFTATFHGGFCRVTNVQDGTAPREATHTPDGQPRFAL